MPLEFKLTIRLGNAAMLTGEDIAEALRVVASKLDGQYDDAEATHAQSVLDLNGNRVGQWKITDAEA